MWLDKPRMAFISTSSIEYQILSGADTYCLVLTNSTQQRWLDSPAMIRLWYTANEAGDAWALLLVWGRKPHWPLEGLWRAHEGAFVTSRLWEQNLDDSEHGNWNLGCETTMVWVLPETWGSLEIELSQWSLCWDDIPADALILFCETPGTKTNSP
jgi:hypothetical protein